MINVFTRQIYVFCINKKTVEQKSTVIHQHFENKNRFNLNFLHNTIALRKGQFLRLHYFHPHEFLPK